jgi:hypothetical protein
MLASSLGRARATASLAPIDAWGGTAYFSTDRVARETRVHSTETDGVPTSQGRSDIMGVWERYS